MFQISKTTRKPECSVLKSLQDAQNSTQIAWHSVKTEEKI